MIRRTTLRHGVAVLVVAAVGVLVSGASAAPITASPTLRLVSICTDQEPFAVQGLVTGLEPNTSYGIRALFSTGGSAGTVFTTDGTGTAIVGSTLATSPFEARIIIWRGGIVQGPGDPIVIDQTFVVDRPCEDGRLKLPANKDQCKNGGWQTFGGFKNQGDCVSSVATGGKNPPAGGTQP